MLVLATLALNVTRTLCSSSYLDLQVVSLVLGFMSGNWTLTPYVCSHMVGVERLAEAHGILMFFGGVGLTLGPPVVGKVVSGSGLVSGFCQIFLAHACARCLSVSGCFYDVTQSYDSAFYLSGGCMMAGSLALLLAAFLPRTETPPPPPPPSCMVTMATPSPSTPDTRQMEQIQT